MNQIDLKTMQSIAAGGCGWIKRLAKKAAIQADADAYMKQYSICRGNRLLRKIRS